MSRAQAQPSGGLEDMVRGSAGAFRRHWAMRLCVALFVAACALGSSLAFADAKSDALIRFLQTSNDARVRAQAALALGRQPPSAAVEAALVKSLQDPQSMVRTASAAALDSLRAARARMAASAGSASLLVATSPTSAKSMPSAPSRVRYYVQIGMPSTQVRNLPAHVLLSLRDEVAQHVGKLDGVRIAPAREDRATAELVLRKGAMAGYFLDPIVTKLEHRSDGLLSAQVSVVVATYPGRNIKAMLSGKAATSRRGDDGEAQLNAARAAFSTALSRLPQLLEAGASEGPPPPSGRTKRSRT